MTKKLAEVVLSNIVNTVTIKIIINIFFQLFLGTREGKTAAVQADSSVFETLARHFKYFCWCCIPPNFREKPPAPEEQITVDDDQGADSKGKSGKV